MTDITSLIQQSIINVKSKVLPVRVANSPAGVEGDLLMKQQVYDYFGLDFKVRTGREMLEVNKKVDTIIDYLRENYDDLSAGLGEVERQAGPVGVNENKLEHFYRTIKYKNEAFESLPQEERSEKQTSRVKEVESEIAALHGELKAGAEKLREAKEMQRLASKLERLEKMRESRMKKLEKLQQDGENRLAAIKKQQEELLKSNATPSTDL